MQVTFDENIWFHFTLQHRTMLIKSWHRLDIHKGTQNKMNHKFNYNTLAFMLLILELLYLVQPWPTLTDMVNWNKSFCVNYISALEDCILNSCWIKFFGSWKPRTAMKSQMRNIRGILNNILIMVLKQRTLVELLTSNVKSCFHFQCRILLFYSEGSSVRVTTSSKQQVAYSAYSLTKKMSAVFSSEASVNCYQTIP
jgi:hypothetical protein